MILTKYNNLPLFRKVVIAILLFGIILLGYGTIARWLNIYFFWEAISWGLGITILSAVVLGLHIGFTNEKGEERLWFLLLGGVAFIIYLGVIYFFNFYVPATTVYQKAVEYIKQSEQVKAEVGSITGISMLPQGSLKSENSISVAYLCFTVKGTEKYIDAEILLFKSPEQPEWKVLTDDDNVELPEINAD